MRKPRARSAAGDRGGPRRDILASEVLDKAAALFAARGFAATSLQDIADQAGVVKAYKKDRYDSGDTFTVDAATPITKLRSKYMGAGYLPDALVFARANGLRMTLLEATHFVDSKTAVRSTANEPTHSLESVLTGADADSLNAAADDWVAALMPDIDLGTSDHQGFLRWDENRALQAAIKKAMTPPQVPVTQAMVDAAVRAQFDSVPVVLSSDIGENDLVGIKGNTKEWKDPIKAAAVSNGGRAIWDGDNVQWNVPYKAWKYLVENNPRCTQPGQLEMVEFSGKAAYGKRK